MHCSFFDLQRYVVVGNQLAKGLSYIPHLKDEAAIVSIHIPKNTLLRLVSQTVQSLGGGTYSHASPFATANNKLLALLVEVSFSPLFVFTSEYIDLASNDVILQLHNCFGKLRGKVIQVNINIRKATIGKIKL